MIVCSCCEFRLGHSCDSCECSANFCIECLLCEWHCQCTKAVDLPADSALNEGKASSIRTVGGPVPTPRP
jgi:hypothetical protein